MALRHREIRSPSGEVSFECWNTQGWAWPMGMPRQPAPLWELGKDESFWNIVHRAGMKCLLQGLQCPWALLQAIPATSLPPLNRSLGIQSAQLIWKGLAAKDRNSGISLRTKIVAFPLHTKQPHGLNIIHKRRLLWQRSTQLRKYKYFEGNHSPLWVRAWRFFI